MRPGRVKFNRQVIVEADRITTASPQAVVSAEKEAELLLTDQAARGPVEMRLIPTATPSSWWRPVLQISPCNLDST